MQIMRKLFLILVTSLAIFLSISTVNGQNWFNYSNQWYDPKSYLCDGWDCSIKEWINDSKKSLQWNVTDKKVSDYIQDLIVYGLSFVSLIAVIYIIYSGFQVMIWNGDDKKLSDSKKTILHIIIGMIIMWLAYAIVSFITSWIIKSGNPWKTGFFQIIPTTHAAYTENEAGTFAEYKSRIQAAIEELESELRVNKQVQVESLRKVQNLVNQAANLLPDKDPQESGKNESAKRAVDMYINIAINAPDDTSKVGNAISQVANYINNAKIQSVRWSIVATPTTWNAPLTVSFLANGISDPSGTTPPASNYIWWVRENGGVRKELWRWASFSTEFTNEWTYKVFLDVVSASKNSKWKTDVLPLSTQVDINVLPKLWEIVLLVNGVNVSNMTTLKVSPVIGSQGIIFDATASKAIGNGRIVETKWNFENGNSRNYKSSPVVEREIFATEGMYNVVLELKTNDWQIFSKNLQLIVKDPAAVIKSSSEVLHVGENITFTAESHLGINKNIEYIWQIQDKDGNKTIKTSNWQTLSHNFDKVGEHIVTLTTKSPNGWIDSDSKIIRVESRNPIVSIDSPISVSENLPNTIIFDGSRSYDPDTNSKWDLTYTWRIDDKKIELENTSNNWAKGTYTFDSTGKYIVSLAIANKYWKAATATQNFEVRSTLAGELTISPQVSQAGKEISMKVASKNAEFYEWNFGDGSPIKSWNNPTITHTYDKTGIYNLSVKITNSKENNATTINKKIYITDRDAPFAKIDITNSSSSAIEESGICWWKDAYILKRSENTTLNAGNSINVDGNIWNLDYTWKYMWKVSTNPYISETFTDLGCFPIELTVKSKTNGAKHTTTQYIQLKNQLPQLTNISTHIDSSKKDSQKVIVKAVANGAKDPDGVITSYVWYYKTESDPENLQNIQITQKPEMTFVLPNITEKYHFGVIMEDNDGARVNSTDILQWATPLIIDNENGNINMPLISLSTPSTTVKINEKVRFKVDAKTILGTNITNKSEYAWDFDGDGRIDEKNSSSSMEHTYTKAGTYNMKVRVTHNGVSNTKYQTITVRNELKASIQAYKLPNNKLFVMNTSQGVYDKALWNIGNFSSENLDSIIVDFDEIPSADSNGNIWTLKISSNDSEISSANISIRKATTILKSENENDIIVQTYPNIDTDGTIKIKDSSEALKISLYWNTATNYAIDTNTDIDTNLDGTADNDIDNQATSSYTEGSVFVINDFGNATNKNRNIKITLYNNSTPIATKTIPLVLEFINENSSDSNTQISTEWLSQFEAQKIDELAGTIRNLPDTERTVLMKYYNILLENWDSNFEKTKTLIDIQTYVQDSANITQAEKENLIRIIDEIFSQDIDITNQTEMAIKLIKSLIPEKSENYQILMEKISEIESHPSNHERNRVLGKEILEIIIADGSIEEKYIIIIKNNLQIIINSALPTETEIEKPKNNSSEKWWVMSLLSGLGKTILFIIWIIFLIGIIAFVIYLLKRKDSNVGFQDYMIDKFAHGEEKKETINNEVKTEIKKEDPKPIEDPLKNFTPPVDPITSIIQNSNEIKKEETSKIEDNSVMPDWLKPQNNENKTENPIEKDFSESEEKNNQGSTNIADNNGWLPDWLKPVDSNSEKNFSQTEETPKSNPENISETKEGININLNLSENQTSTENNNTTSDLPDWLKSPSPENQETAQIQENSTNSENQNNKNSLPDWLTQGSLENSENIEKSTETTENTEISENTNSELNQNSDLPDWLKSVEDTSEKISENIEEVTENIEEISKEITEEIKETKEELDPFANFWETDSDPLKIEENNFSYTSNKTSEETTEEATKTEENIISNKNKDSENKISEENSLPSWLIDSANNMETSTENQENQENINEKIKENHKTEEDNNSKTEEKTTKDEKPKSDENIPEWLK